MTTEMPNLQFLDIEIIRMSNHIVTCGALTIHFGELTHDETMKNKFII